MKRYPDICILALMTYVLVTVTTANIAILYYCDNIPSSIIGCDSNFSIQKFDPSIGELKEIRLQLGINTTEDILFENTGNLSDEIILKSEIELSVVPPNSELVSVYDSIIYAHDINSFDEIIDYSGPSGFTASGIVSSNYTTRSYSNLSDFIATSANDTAINLPAISRSNVEIFSSTDYSYQVENFIESKLCVEYVYEPFNGF